MGKSHDLVIYFFIPEEEESFIESDFFPMLPLSDLDDDVLLLLLDSRPLDLLFIFGLLEDVILSSSWSCVLGSFC